MRGDSEQGFGKQLVFGPSQVFGDGQSACAVIEQVPVDGLQHAPRIGNVEQGFGEQLEFAPSQTLGGGQFACVVNVQSLFSGLQQAPVAHSMQGFGSQVVQAPRQSPLCS